MRKIVLVGGTGRCGTTVVNRILDRHPSAVVSPPWRFMIDPDGVLDFLSTTGDDWNPYTVDIRYKRLRQLLKDVARPSLPMFLLEKAGLRKFARKLHISLLPRYAHLNASGFCPEFESIANKYLKNILEFSYQANWVGSRFLEKDCMAYLGFGHEALVREESARFYHEVIDSCLIHHSGELFVDRNTWNHLRFDKFLSLDANIKLIHVYRDPRDVVASYMAQNWMPPTAIEAATIYRDLSVAWWKVRDSVPDNSFIDISLENLVDNPETVLSGICEYLEIPWHNNLLDISLAKANTGRWRKDIPVEQHDKIEEILAPVLDHLGYK